jgi:peroxiredoxin
VLLRRPRFAQSAHPEARSALVGPVNPQTPAVASGAPAGHWKRYRILYAVIAVCVAPVVASYLAFYLFPPSGRTNYGTLLTPQPAPRMALTTLDGRPFALDSLAGKWVLVAAAGGACSVSCAAALLQMRQQRLMVGKERDRVERLWLITDEEPLSIVLMREYEGTHFVRVPAGEARALLATDSGSLDGHVWLIDPMGNLMLRWPQDPEPQRVKKDLARLLTASSHWIRIERKD